MIDISDISVVNNEAGVRISSFGKVNFRNNLLKANAGKASELFNGSGISYAHNNIVDNEYGIVIDGVHVYLGTNIKEAKILLYGIDTFFDFVKNVVHPQIPTLKYVDIGGGIGVKERPEEKTFDYRTFAQGLTRRVMQLNSDLGKEIELAIEPGRSFLADTAVFLAGVTDVKYRVGKKIIGTDASAAVFPRPLLYDDAYHEVEVLGKEGEPTNGILSDICGKTTSSRDYLAKNRQLPSVDIGDILIFQNAGSYCYGVMTDFLGMLRPPEVLLHNEHYRIIREREKLV